MYVIFAKDGQGSGLVSDCVLVSSFVEEICSVVSEDGKNGSWWHLWISGLGDALEVDVRMCFNGYLDVD